MPGLREEKKARTRALIATTAAGLFARHGYPDVTMSQVAAAAGVSDQTLYNYFPTKESLVFDKSDDIRASLLAALTARAPGTGLIDAYAAWLDHFVLGGPAHRALVSPGGMPRLAATSEALHRALLDFAHQTATALAPHLAGPSGPAALASPAALAVSDALLAVLVRVIEQIGTAPDEAALTQISASTRAALDTLRPLATALLAPGVG